MSPEKGFCQWTVAGLSSGWSRVMGHGYYGDNRDVTTDLFMLIKEDLPSAKRSFLERKKSPDGPYWQFARHAPTIMCTWHFEE